MIPTLKSLVCYKRQRGRWPFVLTEDLTVDLGLGLKGQHLFIDRGLSICRLDGDLFTLFAGYASDGCTPYFGCLLSLRIGTPTPQGTAACSWWIHDAMYQFGELSCAPWSYAQADDVFFHLLRTYGWKLASPYHAAVSIFGGIARKLRRNPSTTIACISSHQPR